MSLISIHSGDYLSNETPHDLTVNPTDFQATNSEHYLCLKQITFPNWYPTVKTGVNDRLEVLLVSSNVTYTLVLPEGYYTGDTIASSLQTAIQALPTLGAATVTFNDTNQQLSFSFPANVRFVITSPNTNGILTAVERFHELIGLTNPAHLFQNITSFTCPSPVRLQGTQFVYVCVNFPTGSYHSSVGNYNVLAKVLVDVPFAGELQQDLLPSDKGVPITGDHLQNLRIFLVDQWGQPFIVPPNHTVSYLFLLFKRDE